LSGHVRNFQFAADKPDRKQIIWRFMDLPKFLSIIQNEALTFIRADKLGDPFEGTLPTLEAEKLRETVVRWTNSGHTAGSARLPFEHMKLPLENPANFSWRAHISCWYAQDYESNNMWKIYGGHNSLAIKSTFGDLESQIPDDFDIGAVRYINYDTDTTGQASHWGAFTHKRLFFKDENEIRAMRLDSLARYDEGSSLPPEVALMVKINLSALIREVKISPLADAWFPNVVRNVMDKYGIDPLIATQSEILSRPTYMSSFHPAAS
jgi:hypothetical protein